MSKEIEYNVDSGYQKLSVDERIIKQYPDLVKRDDSDTTRCICIICETEKVKGANQAWYGIETHFTRETHKKAQISYNKKLLAQKEKEGNVEDMNKIVMNPPEVRDIGPDKIIDLHFAFCKFLLENKLPFTSAEPLLLFIQNLSGRYSKAEILQYHTTSYLMKKTAKSITKHIKELNMGSLRSSPFSLSFDESSDIHGDTYMAISAKMFEEPDSKLPVNRLLCVLPITNTSTGEKIAEMLEENILNEDSIRSNFMGCCTDQASNLIGENKGAVNRLAKKYDHILNTNDFSHIFNLVFKKALKAIPEKVKKTVNKICSHFSYSTQRQSALYEIQKENDFKQLKIIRYSPTRWLGM